MGWHSGSIDPLLTGNSKAWCVWRHFGRKAWLWKWLFIIDALHLLWKVVRANAQHGRNKSSYTHQRRGPIKLPRRRSPDCTCSAARLDVTGGETLAPAT